MLINKLIKRSGLQTNEIGCVYACIGGLMLQIVGTGQYTIMLFRNLRRLKMSGRRGQRCISLHNDISVTYLSRSVIPLTIIRYRKTDFLYGQYYYLDYHQMNIRTIQHRIIVPQLKNQ